MATIIYVCVFANNASPAVVLTSTELTGAYAPTINITRGAYADLTRETVVSGGAMTYDANTKSWWYRLASADLAAHVYVAMATTTYSTASPASVHALGIVVPDELVSSRLATAGYTTPPTASAVASQVRTELTTELGRVDATVSSRLAGSAYTAPLDAAGVRTALGLAAADLDTQLDAIAAASGLTAEQVKEAVWTAASRTLTSSAAQTAAAVAGGTLALTSRATYTATLTGLTISASWSRMWFTVKRDAKDADALSVVQIVVSNPAAGGDGLLYLDGVAGTAAQGRLTVDQAAGTVTIWIADDATACLPGRSGLVYDVKQLVAGDTTVLTVGAATVSVTPTAALA